jgi:hypothetical protein
MGAIADARGELGDLLEAADLVVRQSPSIGHVIPPAVLIGPGSEWIVGNAQLGAQLHARLSLSLTFVAGKLAAESSIAELETLIETALPLIVGKSWTLTTIGQPFALSIAATEYLAAAATLTRQLVISGAVA